MIKQYNENYQKKFRVTGNIIENIIIHLFEMQYIFNKKIPYNESYTFKIKIIRKGIRNNIYIGIIDYFKRR